MDSTVISDAMRVPTTAQRLADGRILLRTPGQRPLFFSVEEIERLSRFARGGAHILRYPVNRSECTESDV